jgi:tyrosyl-tRNA synthetase
MNTLTIGEQVNLLMQGADFGDEQTKQNMKRELHDRLLESAETGRPLRVYCGYDPTAPDIHLGHTVTMRKLRQFQELGHHCIFLIGTFTGLVGDNSDKDRARPLIHAEELLKNAQTYIQQAFRILDPERTEVLHNADWLSKLALADVIQLAAHFTVQQFLVRENFSKRQQKGDPIWLHEFLYALMQGYDAVTVRADVQLGGSEQLFNLLVGRKLQEIFGQKPQVCLTFPILVGTDGVLRMSKSTGNYVGIDETPENKYGKTMSIPDSAMRNWFELVTRWTPGQVRALLESVEKQALHPMEAKKKLAWEIVAALDGNEAADRAAIHFESVHQARQQPRGMDSWILDGAIGLVDLIYEAGFASSKSQARRLIQQGAVKFEGRRVIDVDAKLNSEGVLQVGKRLFMKISKKSGTSHSYLN